MLKIWADKICSFVWMSIITRLKKFKYELQEFLQLFY